MFTTLEKCVRYLVMSTEKNVTLAEKFFFGIEIQKLRNVILTILLR